MTVCSQRTRDQVGVFQLRHANGQVITAADQVGQVVFQAHFHLGVRVALHVQTHGLGDIGAPEVARAGDLQDATRAILIGAGHIVGIFQHFTQTQCVLMDLAPRIRQGQ